MQRPSTGLRIVRLAVTGLVALAISTGIILATAVPAAAAGTYRTTTSTLNVRTGPGTGYGIITTVSAGTSFTLLCQWQGGTPISGNATWDKVRFSTGVTGAISDYYTTTPSFNNYAPNTGRCDAPPSAGTPTATGREQRALAWARSVLGQTRTGGDLGDSNHLWDGWCDNFVAHAYGRRASGYNTAIDHYTNLRNRGLIHAGDTNPPAGALVFFAATALNGRAGHVMLAEGTGGYLTSAATVRRVPSLGWAGSAYLGWAYANPEWAGR